MSRIRRLAPSVCPQCGAQNSLFIDLQRQLICRLCGHHIGKREETPPPAANAANTTVSAEPPSPDKLRRRYPVSYALTLTREVSPRAKSTYYNALEHLERGQYDKAIYFLQRALEEQSDLVEAHLWLGRLLTDAASKRYHFESVLNRVPSYAEAIRELMVLQGELTPEEAERARQGGGRVATAEVPVAAVIKTQECPVCGGQMGAKREGDNVCQSCGYVRKVPLSGAYGAKSFSMEMLRRRGQKIRWQVGERLLRCKSCGAETLLQAQVLTVRCPFCGSRGVVETDALRSFMQPDGIVLFELELDEAQQALEAALNSRTERIKGLFINNRAASTWVTPVYLPFWLFDITLQVNVTVEDHFTGLYAQEQYPDGASGVTVCGVESPPRSLTDRLGPFSLEVMRPYHHDLLAGKTAELYNLDFEQAALLARQRVSHEMRQRYGHGKRNNTIINVSSLVQVMQFRLALLPVYVVTVIERDGDHRSALIHGQTGQVILGVAARPRH
ncbi:MAG: hypothetical protein SNJ54_09000 [Anaerolineae bacterium]